MSIILRNILTKFKKYPGQVSNFCSVVNTTDNVHEAKVKINIPTAPIISTINYHDEDQMYQQKRQVWIDSLDTIEEKKLGLMTLHPAIFADKPRLDTLYENVRWQRMFRFVNYTHVKNRAERRGGGRKPWPQKGGGRARHGSINSPLFKNAGRAHGPRSPTVHFYMLPFFSRVNGLTAALSVKLAQDDLYVVNSLEIPSKDPKYIESLMEERNWGPSLLLVDTEDIMPENITIATDELKHVNLMPAYGLNVYSMLKHSTLVLTERAVRHIESRILYQLYRPDTKALLAKFKLSQV